MTDLLIEFIATDKSSPLDLMQALTDRLQVAKEQGQIESYAVSMVSVQETLCLDPIAANEEV